MERSSYESHPLGRLEWIRLYGVLFDKEEEADSFYEAELEKLEPIMKKESCNVTVAFFSVTANGTISVRKSNDYVAQMIALSGGTYVPEQLAGEEENALSTMNIQMEDFYADANVYCTTNNFFQKSTAIGDFMEDLNKIIRNTDTEEAGYLKKLR